MVPAPIKRHTVFDIHPRASVVRRWRDDGWSVHVLEWLEGDAPGGLADHVGLVARIVDEIGREVGLRPVVVGHSLGGTLAALAAAAVPEGPRALVLVDAPVKFGADAGALGAIVQLPQGGAGLPRRNLVPGTFLDLVATAAAPDEIQMWRFFDWLAAWGDAEALDLHMRVERWSLDEKAMAPALLADVADLLYRQDLFFAGRLALDGDGPIGPQRLTMPLLAVVCEGSRIVPPSSTAPIVEAAASREKRLLRTQPERGCALPHLSALVGRQAHAALWPQIMAWANRIG